MSKIGKQPIVIPEGVQVNIKDNVLEIKGKSATLKVRLLPGINVELKDGAIHFATSVRNGMGIKRKQIISNWGTMRALTANAVKGAIEDFTKELIVEGVGYRAELQGNILVLTLGFSHQVKFSVPDGVKVSVEKNTIKISGPDRQLVGEVAAKIRKIRKPEPYKGKGIMYKDEIVRRKAGKKAVGSA